MLRRKPTALTISPEDLASFEAQHTQYLESRHARSQRQHHQHQHQHQHSDWTHRDKQAQSQSQSQSHDNDLASDQTSTVDPNDELKPLPGGKARIVRSREERIMGVGGAGSGASTSTPTSNSNSGHGNTRGNGPSRM